MILVKHRKHLIFQTHKLCIMVILALEQSVLLDPNRVPSRTDCIGDAICIAIFVRRLHIKDRLFFDITMSLEFRLPVVDGQYISLQTSNHLHPNQLAH